MFFFIVPPPLIFVHSVDALGRLRFDVGNHLTKYDELSLSIDEQLVFVLMLPFLLQITFD